jgi:chemotaxis protein methyltransferase CheR
MTRGAPPAIEALRARVVERTGLDLSGVRARALEAALERAAAGSGRTPEALARALVDGVAPLRPLLEELSVGETWFFREPEQWRFVADVVVLEARARRAGAPVLFRGWSAGCATGEEAYSLAIVLDEAGLGDAVHLVATDLNETALERARRAEFSVWSLRGGADARARRHLEERAGTFALDPRVARRVRFHALNLAAAEYPSWSRGIAELDLVLCRNVLIYLDRSLLPAIARRLFASLVPGGWLLLGASDPPLARHAPFAVRPTPAGLAYQRPLDLGAVALPPAGRRRAAPAREAARVARAPRAAPARTARPPAPPSGAAAPAVTATVSAARALLDAGRSAEALAAAEAALAREPLDAAAWFEKAIALSELGRVDAAEEACGRALYLAPGEPFVHHFTGLLRLRRGDAPAAARAFATAAALAARLPPDEPLPLSHGLTAGEVQAAAAEETARLAGAGPPGPGR